MRYKISPMARCVETLHLHSVADVIHFPGKIKKDLSLQQNTLSKEPKV